MLCNLKTIFWGGGLICCFSIGSCDYKCSSAITCLNLSDVENLIIASKNESLGLFGQSEPTAEIVDQWRSKTSSRLVRGWTCSYSIFDANNDDVLSKFQVAQSEKFKNSIKCQNVNFSLSSEEKKTDEGISLRVRFELIVK